ncbi:MAG: M81 family metallopeptidase, partial [Chloroflexaceae bacterium]|nr:M81 family metallopeptidase [Chloroflexaceae bacterium]
MFRVAVGGIGSENSTFSPLRTRLADFDIVRGADLLHDASYTFLAGYPLEALPLLSAWALPGGPIEQAAYTQLKSEFLEGLRRSLPLDGVYLNLHGAMFVDGMLDAEADLLHALRGVVGPDCLIAASMDLHGNISAALVQQLDIITGFRTAPHIDVAETQARAVDLLLHCLNSGIRPQMTHIAVPIILPGERTSTVYEPAASLYGRLPAVSQRPGVLDASLFVGYVWADEPRTSASVVVVGTAASAMQQAARELAAQFWAVRAQFDSGMPVGSIDECITMALAAPEPCVFISDSGDNPTAGGVGDLPIVLAHLLRAAVPSAVLASIPDAQRWRCVWRRRWG